MAPAYLPAIAALAGSMIGGVAMLASAWLTQHRQDRAQQLTQEKASRADLYRRFIDEASKLYGDALVRNEAEIAALVSVYGLISQMYVVSSPSVVEEAEAAVRMIVDTYFAPNKTFTELRTVINGHPRYPLRTFSEKCRAELEGLKAP